MFHFRSFVRLISVWTALFCNQHLIAQDTISAPTDSVFVIRGVYLSGNNITKPLVILRELTFKVGDTVRYADMPDHAVRSRQNLLNTSLFNFVTIIYAPVVDSLYGQFPSMYINIDVKERWYTWPAPVFDVAEQNINTWWRNGHNLKRATYGFLLTRYNFRGRRETVAVICRFGYAQQFGGQYSIPYINRRQTLGITFTGLYTKFHEVYYKTAYNQLVYYKDKERFVRNEISASMKLVWRKEIYQRHSLELKFADLKVSDSITDITSDYFVNDAEQMRYFTLSYQYVRDYRDAKYYPLHGYLFDVEITRHGLGIMPDEDLNVTFVAASVRKWFEVSKRIFAGAMIRGRWLPKPDPPYYHQRALGFSTYVRGYEYYVIDGQSYAIAKSAIRYQVLKPHVFTFKWLPMEKFNTFHLAIYAGLFADVGYVEDRTSVVIDHNSLGNSWISGYGAGLDLVTYYDLVFRIEYTFNNLGEGGFYLHMGAPF